MKVIFKSNAQQDAHEFLMYLLNYVSETVQSLRESADEKKLDTFVHDSFQGIITTETKCLTCENRTTRDEKFIDLSIDIEQNTSISHCLKMFCKIEMLSQENKFFCEQCYSLQEAKMR